MDLDDREMDADGMDIIQNIIIIIIIMNIIKV
jgi:hypothetical protein